MTLTVAILAGTHALGFAIGMITHSLTDIVMNDYLKTKK